GGVPWPNNALAELLADRAPHARRRRVAQLHSHGATARDRVAGRRLGAQLHAARPIERHLIEAPIPPGLDDDAAGDAVIGVQADAHHDLLAAYEVPANEKGDC